jgi:glutathione S-transferase
MVTRLVGHYDSPFVRRVGISLHVLRRPFERLPLSVFRHADELRRYNPLGRVPALILDDGDVLIDSGAILDHLDNEAGPERALVPSGGAPRREALRLIAIATGVADKCVAIAYEQRRPPDKIDPGWIARCRGQIDQGLAALQGKGAALVRSHQIMQQPQITIGAVLGYVRLREPDALPPGKYPDLEALSAILEAMDAFKSCRPTLEEIGGAAGEAPAALLRLLGGSQSR